jgi:tRNA uridine 5-carboxymethylaminomethyl modification enzyme
LVDDHRWRAHCEKRNLLEKETARLKSLTIHAHSTGLEAVLGRALTRDVKAYELLRRPEVSYRALTSMPAAAPGIGDDIVAEQLEIQARYDGYIERQLVEIEKQRRQQEQPLPIDIDYDAVPGLSTEVRQRLNAYRPTTVGQAGRISGVTPAAISLLLVHLKKRANHKSQWPRARAAGTG